MEEENRSFSWSGLFIKIILVVIFVIFTVWLISLSTKDMSDSLDVLTDDIFSENLEKMKKVGKEYFTKDKLPLQIGEIEKITLEEMYEKNLILEIKDKNGDACSKENSYISVEKFENEYQMKVYLECGKAKDYVIVTITCSEVGTCVAVDNKATEYEYKKINGGSWGKWGEWSDWSKVEISKLDNRDVETKVEKEEYTYEAQEQKLETVEFNKECPEGYVAYGNTCKKTISTLDRQTTIPICPQFEDYLTTSRNGFTCNYTKYVKGEKIDTRTGDKIPADNDKEIYEEVGTPVYKLIGTEMQWIHTYAVYASEVKTATGKAECAKGYKEAGDICEKFVLGTDTVETDSVCIEKEGYTLKTNSDKCEYEREVTVTVTKTGTKDVTYYRYRLREYKNGTTTYKWSSSKNDESLLNAGYKLTGKTR